MTSNCAEELYPVIGYDKMIENYKNTLGSFVGPTTVMVCGDTLQVTDYDRYDWTMFDAEAKKTRHEEVFQKEMNKAFSLGAEIAKNNI